jgi:hypothetical protein
MGIDAWKRRRSLGDDFFVYANKSRTRRTPCEAGSDLHLSRYTLTGEAGSSMISSGQGEKKIPLDGGTAFPPLVLPLRSPGLSLLSRFRPTFFRLGAKKTRSVIHGLHIRRGVFAAGRRLSSDQTPDLESDFMAHYGALSDRWRRPRTRGPGDKTTCPYLERNVMCSCPPSIQRTLWRL